MAILQNDREQLDGIIASLTPPGRRGERESGHAAADLRGALVWTRAHRQQIEHATGRLYKMLLAPVIIE